MVLRDHKPRSSKRQGAVGRAAGVPLPAEGGRHRGGGAGDQRLEGTGRLRNMGTGAKTYGAGVAQRVPRPRDSPRPTVAELRAVISGRSPEVVSDPITSTAKP